MYEDYEDYEVELPEAKIEEEEDILEVKINLDMLKDSLKTETLGYVNQNMKDRLFAEAKKELIDKELKTNIKYYLEHECDAAIQKMVEGLFDENVVISHGWGEKEEVITYRELALKTIKNKLESTSSSYGSDKSVAKRFEEKVEKYVQDKLEEFENSMKREINNKLKDLLDAATRQTLTDNVVNLLMQNDTYQRLQTSMENIIGIDAKK